MYQIVIPSKLCVHPWTGLEFRGFGVLKCKAYFGKNRVSLFFFKILYVSSIVAIISLLGSVLKVIEKLRPFARRSVLTWVNCLEHISITHFFLSVVFGLLYSCWQIHKIFVYISFLLVQKISYTIFHKSFLQDGTQ